MLLVLLLLVHHRTVLAAGQAAVLGRHAAAVFGFMSIAGEKIVLAVLAHTGSMPVVKAVHQIKAIKLHDAVKADTLDEHHFLLLAGVSGKDICGLHDGRYRELFDFRHGESVHHMPEIIAGKTVVGGDGKEGLIPLLETRQISPFKIVRRYNKMINAKGMANAAVR